MYRFSVALIFSLAVYSTCLSQAFVFIESSLSDMRYHHFNQMHLVQLSLKENRIYPRIEFSDGYDFKAELEQLSSKLQKTIPAEYWNAKSRPALTDTVQRISPEYFVKWTFGKIEKDKRVTYYGQLILYFGDTSTSATVTRVLFKNTNEVVAGDAKKVIELYDRYEGEKLRNPPPPLPPPIRGN